VDAGSRKSRSQTQDQQSSLWWQRVEKSHGLNKEIPRISQGKSPRRKTQTWEIVWGCVESIGENWKERTSFN
jgi:hypothetical protein